MKQLQTTEYATEFHISLLLICWLGRLNAEKSLDEKSVAQNCAADYSRMTFTLRAKWQWQ